MAHKESVLFESHSFNDTKQNVKGGDHKLEREKLKKAVTLLTEARSDLDELMGIQAKMLWSCYNKLKEEGFNDEQAFELTKRAAPKQMEMKLKKKG